MSQGMSNLGRCKSCGKTIRWLKSDRGHNMPIDAETTSPTDTMYDAKVHISHHATCPNAAAHRTQKPCGCKEVQRTLPSANQVTAMSIAAKSRHYENFTDRIDFGKHKGKIIDDVITEDPGWLKWAVLNIAGFSISEKIEREVMSILKK